MSYYAWFSIFLSFFFFEINSHSVAQAISWQHSCTSFLSTGITAESHHTQIFWMFKIFIFSFFIYVCISVCHIHVSAMESKYGCGAIQWGHGHPTRSHTCKENWAFLSHRPSPVNNTSVSSTGWGAPSYSNHTRMLAGWLMRRHRRHPELFWVHEGRGPAMSRRHCFAHILLTSDSLFCNGPWALGEAEWHKCHLFSVLWQVAH